MATRVGAPARGAARAAARAPRRGCRRAAARAARAEAPGAAAAAANGETVLVADDAVAPAAMPAGAAAAVSVGERTRTGDGAGASARESALGALPAWDPSLGTLDLVVVGMGPAGLSAAEEASRRGMRVVVVEPRPNAAWPNNYGVWIDEFEAMGLEDCIDTEWQRAKVQFTEKEEASVLDRKYGRVNRRRLKDRLLKGCVANGVVFHAARAVGVTHAERWRSAVKCSDGAEVLGAAVLDGTGHARSLVEFEGEFDPGYQGAYGIMIEVESHPFELDTMFFMDWRDDHLAGDVSMRERNAALPTFLYTMPFSPTRIFVEETSLVARPAVPFPELKARLEKRLAGLGVVVKEVLEEEYCLIPMGGVLPRMPQRVLGLGGTGGMVHPATGFMIARTLGAAPLLIDALETELTAARRQAASALPTGTPREDVLAMVDMDEVSARVWSQTWPDWRLQQREFFNTGMDILLRLGLDATRSFFAAFFKTSTYNWQGFLSYRLTLVELFSFGLEFFAVGDWRMRKFTTVNALPGVFTLFQKIATGGFSRQVGITEGEEGVRWRGSAKGDFDEEMKKALETREEQLPKDAVPPVR